MRDTIIKALHALQEENGIRIMVAAESGSRAWGHAQPDSDWDVRFIFIRPVEDYLALQKPADVVELQGPDDLDIVGWDIRKALWLVMQKANAQPREWMLSKMRYMDPMLQDNELLAILEKSISAERLRIHYKGLARSSFEKYKTATRKRAKRLSYSLRAAMTFELLLAHEPGEVPLEVGPLLVKLARPGLTAAWRTGLLPDMTEGTEKRDWTLIEDYIKLTLYETKNKVPARAPDGLWATADDALQRLLLGET